MSLESLKRAAKKRFARLAVNPRLMTGCLLAVILLSTHALVWLIPSVFGPLQSQSIDRLFRLRERISVVRPTYEGTVFLVTIDDDSVQRRDGFYLGRQDYAQLVQNLDRAGVATQFLDVIFAAPESEQDDRLLAEALGEAGNAFVGMAVGASARDPGHALAAPSPVHAEVLRRQRWTDVEVRGGTERLLRATRYFMTFPEVAGRARGIGHLDLIPDRDGVIRRVPLLVRDGDGFLPSMHLLVLSAFLDVEPAQMRLERGRLVLAGARRPGRNEAEEIAIPIDEQGQMAVNFIGAWGALPSYPFSAVYTASDDRFLMEDLREELEGRIAIVSWFSTGRGDVGAVPTDPVYPRAGVWANAMNTILTGEFIRELSVWQMLLFVELPLLLILFLAATRLSTIPYVLSAVAMFLLYLLIVSLSFLGANLILNVPSPLIVLIAATPVIAAYQFHLESEKRAKVNRELAVAREIQLGTLPAKMPDIDGYDLAGHSVPADETGGDSFDVISLENGRLMLLLGDATGHGIGPALSVTQVRSMLRVATRLRASLDDAVKHINDQLADDLTSNRFVTAFLGVLDGEAHRVEYHSAGQGPLLHFHAASGECEWLGSSTMALGIFGGLPIKAAQALDLAPGDILGLMTDGVFEQENAALEQFGEERVAELVRKHHQAPMSELLQAIYAAVETHRTDVAQSDDVTVLLVRRLPKESP